VTKSLVLLAVVLIVAVSCGAPDPGARSTSPQTIEPDAATAAPTTVVIDNGSMPPTSEPRGTADGDLSVLRDRIDETTARRTAVFALDVTQELPVPGPNGVTTTRTGAFDDDLLMGQGSLRFAAESVEVAELLGAGLFEYRLINDTYWFLNPLADPPSWGGYDVIEFANTVDGDPTLSMDGDLYILVVADAIIELTGYEQDADGSERWSVMIRADDLLPLVTTGGVQQRLLAGGFGSTGIAAAAEIFVDANGMVTGFETELDEWWQQAVTSLIPEPALEVTMRVRFELSDFDAPIEVVTPCSNPTEFKEPGFLDGLICDA
jgi:hypothetical protein